jgi:hypothetical protein
MHSTRVTTLEPGCRVQLPAEWARELGLQGEVLLTRTEDGILVKPRARLTWDEIFSNLLTIRPGDPSVPPEITEITGDDLLF